MKKIITSVLALSFALALAACGGPQSTTMQSGNSTTSTSNTQNADKGGIISALEEIIQPEKELIAFEELFVDGPIIAQGQNELWGYIDITGAWVVEPVFTDKPQRFVNGYARVQDPETELWGFIQADGSWVAESKYKELNDFSEGLANAQDAETEKWGYIDTSGNWVIAPKYQRASAFHEGLAAILPYVDDLQDGEVHETGYIDKSGKLVIPYQYATAWLFNGDRAIVTYPSLYGNYMIDKDGNNLGSLPYDFIPFGADTIRYRQGWSTYAKWSYDWMILASEKFANTVSDDLYRGGGLSGFAWDHIDMSGFESIVIDKDLNVVFSGFEHNCYVFRVLNERGDLYVMDKSTGKYGIINIDGTWLFEPIFESVLVYANHVLVSDTDADMVINFIRSNGYETNEIEIEGIGGDNPPAEERINAVAVEVDGAKKYMAYDSEHNPMNDKVYDQINYWADDGSFYVAKVDNLLGISDRDGNWLIQPQYLELSFKTKWEN